MRHVLVIFLLAGSLLAAPAPVHKKSPPTHKVEGAWRMQWRGATSEVWFAPGGKYYDTWNGQVWVGEWVLVGRVLSVSEISPDGHKCDWRANLDPVQKDHKKYTGTLVWDGNFSLSK